MFLTRCTVSYIKYISDKCHFGLKIAKSLNEIHLQQILVELLSEIRARSWKFVSVRDMIQPIIMSLTSTCENLTRGMFFSTNGAHHFKYITINVIIFL